MNDKRHRNVCSPIMLRGERLLNTKAREGLRNKLHSDRRQKIGMIAIFQRRQNNQPQKDYK